MEDKEYANMESINIIAKTVEVKDYANMECRRVIAETVEAHGFVLATHNKKKLRERIM